MATWNQMSTCTPPLSPSVGDDDAKTSASTTIKTAYAVMGGFPAVSPTKGTRCQEPFDTLLVPWPTLVDQMSPVRTRN